jgi:predicted acetylornithine/succinylornithine family transaminase
MNTNASIVAATGQHLIPNYGRLPVAMVRGRGATLWDADGNEFIDLFAGFGATGVTGHSHPAVAKAVAEMASTLQTVGNLFTNPWQVELAAAITTNAFGGKVFFCHSGAEANEAALKLARFAGGLDGRPGQKRRWKLVSFHHCFHGRTMGGLSLTPEKYGAGFEPLLPGCSKATYGDLDSVAALLDDETAAVFAEPIQGEGGMTVPSVEFMQGLRRLCTERGVTLVCDEVWTAPARTGKWFAHQHYGIEPDIMTLGKACGGGLPVAACVASPKLADVLQPGKHGCTLGGNPLCAAAGVATFNLIRDENLLAAAERKGAAVMQQLRAANVAKVKDVRGKGLMLGVELDGPGKDIFTRCLARGLLINVTQDTVIRLAPPLVIEDDLLARGIEVLIEELRR